MQIHRLTAMVQSWQHTEFTQCLPKYLCGLLPRNNLPRSSQD